MPRKSSSKSAKRNGTTRARGKAGNGRTTRTPWTAQDEKQLRTLIKQSTPTRQISTKLRRTEGSIRQKAFQLGISLRGGR